MNETRYPLCWPSGWKRTAIRTRAQFSKGKNSWDTTGARTSRKSALSIEDSFGRIEYEMERFGVDLETVIVSTNLRANLRGVPSGNRGEPGDPGVCVYWKLKGKSQCMPIDRYSRVADNLAAVAATLEAMRAIERHGGSQILDRAFVGFAQLPEAIVTQRPWREVLGLDDDIEYEADEIDSAFRAKAKQVHPDIGGSDEAMAELNRAREEALAESERS